MPSSNLPVKLKFWTDEPQIPSAGGATLHTASCTPLMSAVFRVKSQRRREGRVWREGGGGGVCLDPGQPSKRGKPGAQEVGMHIVMQLCKEKKGKDSECLEALVLKAPVHPFPLPISVAVAKGRSLLGGCGEGWGLKVGSQPLTLGCSVPALAPARPPGIWSDRGPQRGQAGWRNRRPTWNFRMFIFYVFQGSHKSAPNTKTLRISHFQPRLLSAPAQWGHHQLFTRLPS